MGRDENRGSYVDRLVDERTLEAYLTHELGAATTYEVTRHPAGHSNETLFVTWGDRDLVVRRPPAGETADTAHDVLREYHVVDALQDTETPVPPTVLACEDHSVVGSDFYVMERVAGDVLRDEDRERFTDPANRRAVGDELVDALVDVHALDYESVGLGDLGRPAGFTQRQVERWGRQFEWATETTAEHRAVPLLETVEEWLRTNVPETQEHALVHGDYKLDNVMFAPGATPELVAIFDWELSALGDPLTDLGWLLAFWRNEGDAERAVPELVPAFTEEEGYPTRQELVDRYERRSGRTFEHERFYRTLAVYKLAVLGEMFFARHLRGDSADPMYPVMEARVPALADRALRIVQGEEPL